MTNFTDIKTITFNQTGTFRAHSAAESFLERKGFSVGCGSVGDPLGVMWGRFLVAKWRNLTEAERSALHGRIVGDRRNGPLTFYLHSNAPAQAVAALEGVES